MIWYALIIPILVALLGWVLFRNKIVWWEVLLPLGISLLAIVISYYSMKSATLSDVEYNGYLITEAKYYEPYETWVKKTCSEQYACGTYTTGSGKNRTTHTKYCTRYYDCSYCDDYSAKYTMIDTKGNEISISKEKYEYLIKEWNATPQFVELNRDINYHFGCGKDGNMYSVKWDNNPLTSETTTYEVGFTNILKCNHSAFNYPVIEEEAARQAGLYDYPKLIWDKYQPSILGLDSINYNDKYGLIKRLDYLNGAFGSQYKVKVFTLFFRNKDIQTSFLQEAYWDGGNQNEIVVCIGVDDGGNFTWVRPFSWCDNKLVLVDIREDLMEGNNKTPEFIYQTYVNTIQKNWHYKSFKDFNYLSFEPTTGQLIFVYILTLLISVGCVWWAIKNEFEH